MAVYFIRSEEYIKIGHAVDVNSRLVELQVGSPIELELLGTITSDDDLEMETVLHNLFSDNHVRGEWFRVCSEIYDYLEQKCIIDPVEHKPKQEIWYTSKKQLREKFPPINVIDRGAPLSPELEAWLAEQRYFIDKMREDVDQAGGFNRQKHMAQIHKQPEQLAFAFAS